MRVLSIDTAGPVVGVGLFVDGTVRVRTERIQRGAEALLLPWARELASEAGLSLSQLDGVAVTRGPGAFTGLRVGLATAAGLAMAVDRPLWTEVSLRTRAVRVLPTEHPVLSLLDARKSRVYALRVGASGEPETDVSDIAPEAALAWCEGPFVATGEGADVYRELVEAAGGVVVADACDPAVDVLARLGAEALARGLGSRAVDVTPMYVRPPDAKPSNKGRI